MASGNASHALDLRFVVLGVFRRCRVRAGHGQETSRGCVSGCQLSTRRQQRRFPELYSSATSKGEPSWRSCSSPTVASRTSARGYFRRAWFPPISMPEPWQRLQGLTSRISRSRRRRAPLHRRPVARFGRTRAGSTSSTRCCNGRSIAFSLVEACVRGISESSFPPWHRARDVRLHHLFMNESSAISNEGDTSVVSSITGGSRLRRCCVRGDGGRQGEARPSEDR